MRVALAGAGAGILGTLAMSLLMLPAQWSGLLGTQPPRRITDRVVGALGRGATTDEDERRAGTTMTHLGIGAVAGAGYALARRATGPLGSPPIVGAAFGSAFWALNYVLVAPALRFFPPPWRDRPGRPPVMLAANAIFGTVTAVAVDALVPDPRGSEARAG